MILTIVKLTNKTIEEYESYSSIDFRYKKLHQYNHLVCGLLPCHDSMLVCNEDKTYMSFCSYSPFGVEILKHYKYQEN